MNKDTPRKKDKREKLANRFKEDWEVDVTNDPKIRYKRKDGIVGLYQKYFGRKHSVFAMYWFFKNDRLENEESRKFYFPIKHDNMPVKDVPFKYELQGTWQIDEDDLKYLYGGPLIDQNGELLVPVETQPKKIIRYIKVITPILAFVSATLGVVIKVPALINLLK